MDGLDEVIKEFLVESYESLDQLDSDLVALEETPDDLDRLAGIFRTVHTIKGRLASSRLRSLKRLHTLVKTYSFRFAMVNWT
ncbi:MAG: Hpt domain-containing protein [Planctomycetota bacterium]|nr:Hpt domain-containing protein [Planctomycetota bacterium]